MLKRPEAAGVELWLHAGDFTNDAEYLARMSGCEVAMVAGNNDWPRTGMPDSRVLDVAGHRIFLTHGHIYGVGYTTAYLEKAAAEQGAESRQRSPSPRRCGWFFPAARSAAQSAAGHQAGPHEMMPRRTDVKIRAFFLPRQDFLFLW